jgi:hypothetical protein
VRTYRSVADPAGLLPAERDPVTGRRVARRDDKRRRRRVRRTRRPWLVAAGVAVVIVTGAAVVAALVAGGDDASSARTRDASKRATATTSTDDIVASAISVQYRGGRQTSKTCVSATGSACRAPVVPWEPLDVRCTADGCTLTLFDRTLPIGTATTSYSTLFPYENPECGTAPVTGSLRGVGEVVTHGVRRPRRIVGTVRVDALAHQLPGYDCNGGVQEFRYDATGR